MKHLLDSMNISLFIRIWMVFIFSVGLSCTHALVSIEDIISLVVSPDDPYQVDAQIVSAQIQSFDNLYPDLKDLGIIPIDSLSPTRLVNPGASIIPSLSSELFTSTEIESFQHSDEK